VTFGQHCDMLATVAPWQSRMPRPPHRRWRRPSGSGTATSLLGCAASV